jgi:hypothetical protein
MMLNPFFEHYDRPEDESECFDDEGNAMVSGNQKFMDQMKQKIDDNTANYEKYF